MVLEIAQGQNDDASALRPWTLQIVPLPEAMTIEEFHRRHPTPIPVEQAALLNRRDPRDSIPAGTRVKRVVGERWPGS